MAKRFWREQVIQPALDRDVDAAIAEQQAVLSDDPNNARAHFALATFLHFQKKTDQAIRHFQKSIALDSGDAAPHLSLGCIYAVRGEYELAWRHAREAEALGAPDLVEMLERYPATNTGAQ
jgi:tetratricopeptide (TPR) repeat protein